MGQLCNVNPPPIGDLEEVSITVDTTKVKTGTIHCYKWGHVVQVYFFNVTFYNNGNNQILATGLPSCAVQQAIVFSNELISRDDSVWISGGGGTSLLANINSKDVAHFNGMVYLSTE